jgi:hypothetical protein
MQTQVLKVAIMAALLVCAVGIAAFARGAYEYSLRTHGPEAQHHVR